MKKKWVLIVLLGIIVLFGGIYGVLKWQEISKQEIIEDIQIDLCDFATEDISKIEIKAQESMSFIKDNAIWKDEEKPHLKYNQSLIKEMINQMVQLTSIQSIGNVQDQVAYGITENSRMITIYNKENIAQTFRIGQEVVGKESLYIWSDTDEKIYVVPKAQLLNVLLLRADFVEVSLTLPMRDKVTSIAIENTDKKGFLAKLNEKKGYTEYDKWILERPYKNKYEANTEQIESYLNTIYNTALDKFVTDESSQLSLYGLNEPTLTVTLNDDFKLIFGNKEGESIYVMTSADSYIYTMQAASLSELQKINTFDMIKKEIYTPTIDLVTQIQFKNQTDDLMLKLEKKKDEIGKESLTGMLQNTTLDEDIVQEVFDKAISLNITHQLVNPEIEEKQERQAEVSIIYTLKDKTTQTIELIPYDPSFYILRYQNAIEFAVDKKQVVDLFNMLIKLIEKS